ncbi:MAG: hypothetical protein ACI9P5_004955 [Saprospiraceae bacterium]|jgi:hypothetical protein
METKQLVSSILRTIEQELTDFINDQSQIDCPIEYEKRVINLARSYGQKVLQGSSGGLPKSRNGKKKS